MDASDPILRGACRCGAMTVEMAGAPIMTAACHCRGCQRMSASAFSLTAMVPADRFRVTAGEPVKGGAQGPDLDHYFCPSCKTWMFSQAAGMDFVNVRPTMFDDARWCDPFIETMAANRLPWAKTSARHSYDAFPPIEDYERLMSEFAAKVARAG